MNVSDSPRSNFSIDFLPGNSNTGSFLWCVLVFGNTVHDVELGATSQFAHLEKFSLNFSISSFLIRVNLLHP